MSRPLHPHWNVGLKTELWYSPQGNRVKIWLMTAGLTLSGHSKHSAEKGCSQI
ncbi:MAG: hypothetical protein IPN19_14480 [Elusimicrobia bacterium]|nr:hypothetical protein [Elusimicrobiota bacterium]